MTTKMKRLTVSVPRDIIEITDKIAIAAKTSRSKIISDCLKEMIDKRKRELLVEGYKALAKEHIEFTKVSENAANQALPDWKEQ